MVKQIILALSILGSVPAFASIIQTDSFWTASVDAGAGRLSDESAIPYGLGVGYQWNMGYSLTAGFEGAYFNHGHVSSSGNTIDSYELAPMASIYYYPSTQLNFFGKIGYAWQVNTVNTVKTKAWEPVAVGGIGYVIPFSQSVYANVYTDLTWSGNGSGALAGNDLTQNTQIKVGIQFMF